ncbi:MAG: heparinase II/III family protein [Pseudomonadota bacterium]|nr:heparinase II/III family protein [Pseudomonadota bacterium]
MSVQSITTRARLTASATGMAGRNFMRRLMRSRLMRWRYRGPAINQLILVPQDLRTSDPSFSSELHHGQCGLAGIAAYIGQESPFVVRPPSPEWERDLHGFGWLRNLTAAGEQIARDQARALVAEWIALNRSMSGASWQPELVARRVISWISHSSLLLQGADTDYYDRVMESLTEQLRYLHAHWRDTAEGTDRLTALVALQLAGLAAAEMQPLLDECARPFNDQLRRQVLPDGGHVSRNPAILIEILLDLLPLKQCYISRNLTPPAELTSAIDRMMPMIRFFRMGDGALARFNGCGPTATDMLATVIAYDDSVKAPDELAEASGYCRLAQGHSIVIADVGSPPPPANSGAAHAGCLSFELSWGASPIVVNCGSPAHRDMEWSRVMRSTLAHSTLSLGHESSGQFLAARLDRSASADARLVGPTKVAASISRVEAGISLSASHDGYESRYGVVHHRRLTLSDEGRLLEGEDKLLAPSGLRGEARLGNGAFQIHFHLHPDVEPRPQPDGKSALLVLRDGTAWMLTTDSGAVGMDQSAYLAVDRGPRRSWQALIGGQFAPGTREAKVNWSLMQVAGEYEWTAAAVSEAQPPAMEEPAST